MTDKPNTRDVLILSGIFLTAVGIGMIYLPAAVIAVGAALLAMGCLWDG